MARGKHLFPFRTEQLSPSAPMVLGPQGPGRVGRRRLFSRNGSPSGGPFCVVTPRVPVACRPASLARVKTARLELRPLVDDDLDALVELDGFEAVRTAVDPFGEH